MNNMNKLWLVLLFAIAVPTVLAIDCDYYVGQDEVRMPNVKTELEHVDNLFERTYVGCIFGVYGEGSQTEMITTGNLCPTSDRYYLPEKEGQFQYKAVVFYYKVKWDFINHNWIVVDKGYEEPLVYEFNVCEIPEYEPDHGVEDYASKLVCELLGMCKSEPQEVMQIVAKADLMAGMQSVYAPYKTEIAEPTKVSEYDMFVFNGIQPYTIDASYPTDCFTSPNVQKETMQYQYYVIYNSDQPSVLILTEFDTDCGRCMISYQDQTYKGFGYADEVASFHCSNEGQFMVLAVKIVDGKIQPNNELLFAYFDEVAE